MNGTTIMTFQRFAMPKPILNKSHDGHDCKPHSNNKTLHPLSWSTATSNALLYHHFAVC
jgi:hypothetical protein